MDIDKISVLDMREGKKKNEQPRKNAKLGRYHRKRPHGNAQKAPSAGSWPRKSLALYT